MDIEAYLTEANTNLHQLSQRSGVAYSTLFKHVKHGHQLSVETAKRLEAFDPRLNAAEILGLKPAAPHKPARSRAAS